jgi:hypothetical protein
MKLGGIFFWAIGQDNGVIIASMGNNAPALSSSSTSTLQQFSQFPTNIISKKYNKNQPNSKKPNSKIIIKKFHKK